MAAAIDIIDLTASSPSPPRVPSNRENISSSSYQSRDVMDESQEKQPRWKSNDEDRDRKGPRYGKGRQEVNHEDTWKHDMYIDEDEPLQSHKRKQDKGDEPHEPSGSKRKGDDSPNTGTIFTIDVIGVVGDAEPVTGVSPAKKADEAASKDHLGSFKEHAGLLLPSNVSIAIEKVPLPSEAVDNVCPMSPRSDASGIDFVDGDRAMGAPRYFEDATATAKPTRRTTCGKCGEEGHNAKDCPNTICLTCGVRNEHGSRSCPVLRFCYNCQGKGHLSKDCPRIGNSSRQFPGQVCPRCGSYKHHVSNCPTIWRIYMYMTDDEREMVLAERESKRKLGFDNGGEGYIARDHWCYNCGYEGHLGDDCKTPGNHDKPKEHSAFGLSNWLTGPFASPSVDVPSVDREARHWETGERFDDGHGFSAELNVGRKGREKAKKKAQEAARQADDDEPDWFDANRADSSDKKNTKRKALKRTDDDDEPHGAANANSTDSAKKKKKRKRNSPEKQRPNDMQPPKYVQLPQRPRETPMPRVPSPNALRVPSPILTPRYKPQAPAVHGGPHSLSPSPFASRLGPIESGPSYHIPPPKPLLRDRIDMGGDEALSRYSEHRARQGRETRRLSDRLSDREREWDERGYEYEYEYEYENRDNARPRHSRERGSRWMGGYDRY